MKIWFLKTFVAWAPLAVVITLLSLLVYAAVQQNFRQTANDPQIQLSEDSATSLNNGANPQSLVPTTKVDMAKSLSPYLIIFDDTGKVVASSVQLDNSTPQPPSGVFDNARQYNQNRLTWEPKDGVRSAIVVTKYNNGFVLSGRSLREVEVREDKLWLMVLIA